MVAALAAVALSMAVGVAVAATPGTYEGWLYKSSGERWRGTFTTLTVPDTDGEERFRLSVYNMRLGCPYLDRNGNPARARFRFVYRGIVQGQRIDDTRGFPSGDNPTNMVRVRGTFVGRRFAGRITVSSAPGVAGACTGSARVRVTR
ncbi:MAG TPA: hypothetical protein VGW10_07635 [Solirubrobacteraceae bacterium]|nr:hypothetical protein [Solirubrobacteraceae bacterium]